MFRMTAYPTPGIKNITYLGANETADGRPVKENFVQVECSASPLASAAVSCKIRVVNLTPSHRGFYRVIFTNSFGELPFVFFVKGNRIYLYNHSFSMMKFMIVCI